ncbi:MAG TPA: AAA family ATPase [Thermomicrobiales bacterium]|jgi:predicted ATPase|nr:AAA family ATPase [Thermomicrobiales bacterium]
MRHLRSIALDDVDGADDVFPFAVPAVRGLRDAPLAFSAPVTFLVGENGSGKSTLLEGIACAAGSITVGSAPADRDPSLAAGQTLARALRLVWTRRTKRGFFLRAEDFFNFARGVDRMRAEYDADLRSIRDDSTLSARAKGFAAMPLAREVGELRRRYGDGLDARSHGEAFLTLFAGRLERGGLILLDEPEAPLSPARQLSLLSLLMHAVAASDTQFIIATHSPILMALPGAVIYQLDGAGLREVAWDQIEHVSLTRAFLNDPAAFLRHL